MNRFIAPLSVTVLVLTAATAVGAAQAAPARPAVLARVAIGDLDLSRPDHARLFKARVEAAGAVVCDARIRAEKLDRWSARACRRDVEDEVRSKLSRRREKALAAADG